MNKRVRTRLLVVTVAILGLVGVLIWRSQGRGGLQYYKTVAQIRAEEAALKGTNVRVAGNVQKGSIQRTGQGLRFVVTDGKQGIPVIYTGPPVETFKDDAEVVVDGLWGEDGTLASKSMITKCPTKFQDRLSKENQAGAAEAAD